MYSKIHEKVYRFRYNHSRNCIKFLKIIVKYVKSIQISIYLPKKHTHFLNTMVKDVKQYTNFHSITQKYINI